MAAPKNVNLSQRIGDEAEQAAVSLIKAQGYTICAQNYRCKAGEIDIIARDGQTMVFVEVRYRSHRQYGGSLASINQAKLNKIQNSIHYYLHSQALYDTIDYRIDVIGYDANTQHAKWIKNVTL